MILGKFSADLLAKLFLLVTVMVTAGIGGAFLLAPSAIPDVFSEVYVRPEIRFYLRFFGAVILGYSYLNSIALTKYVDRKLIEIICNVNIISLTLSAVIVFHGFIQGYIVNMPTLFIFEHLFFLFGFIYIRQVK